MPNKFINIFNLAHSCFYCNVKLFQGERGNVDICSLNNFSYGRLSYDFSQDLLKNPRPFIFWEQGLFVKMLEL